MLQTYLINTILMELICKSTNIENIRNNKSTKAYSKIKYRTIDSRAIIKQARAIIKQARANFRRSHLGPQLVNIKFQLRSDLILVSTGVSRARSMGC